MNRENSATIILPTLNEEKNIVKISKILLDSGYYVIVADDGSADKTAELVKSLCNKYPKLRFFDHSGCQRGLSSSVLDAARFAKTDKIIVIDADFQHPVEKVPELVVALDQFDIVVACRERNEGWSVIRQAISLGGNAFASVVLRLRGSNSCSDPVSGFFGFNKPLLSQINPDRVVGGGFKILIDMLKQLGNKTKIGEVRYVFVARKEGASKLKVRHIIHFLHSLLA